MTHHIHAQIASSLPLSATDASTRATGDAQASTQSRDVASASKPISAVEDPLAWEILLDFAAGKLDSIPAAEARLKLHLGDRYCDSDWSAAFTAVMSAEEDEKDPVTAVRQLSAAALARSSHLAPPQSDTSVGPSTTSESAASEFGARPAQLEALESELMAAVDDLKQRKRIRGTAPTLEDLLNPIEERETGENRFAFPGGDDDIIAAVLKKDDEKMESQGADDEDDGAAEGVDQHDNSQISTREAIDFCGKLEEFCTLHSDA